MGEDLDGALAVILRVKGLDLSGFDSELLRDRLETRRAEAGFSDLPSYTGHLGGSPEECDRLIDSIAINVSWFFRNPIVFEIIRENLLPEIIARKLRGGRREIRVWSAGCAAGQEAYSLAILADDALKVGADDWTPLVFGTDIDREALRQARKGIYSRSDLRSTTLEVMDRCFDRKGEGFAVKPSLRKSVHFGFDDLASHRRIAPPESVFGDFDLVLCRNVIIYFKPELQRATLRKLSRSLAPGGYLVLGDSEFPDLETSWGLKASNIGRRVFVRPLRARGGGAVE